MKLEEYIPEPGDIIKISGINLLPNRTMGLHLWAVVKVGEREENSARYGILCTVFRCETLFDNLTQEVGKSITFGFRVLNGISYYGHHIENFRWFSIINVNDIEKYEL